MRSTPAIPADPGLIERFRLAGTRIQWRAVGTHTTARIAHLNDEEARVETFRKGRARGLRTDAGPVGALVLLLEVDRRGPPSRLRTIDVEEAKEYLNGAFEVSWGSPRAREGGLSLNDLVSLARYAFA